MTSVTTTSGLEVHGLNAGCPGRAVVKDAELAVQAGQVASIAGPRGCGTSTWSRADELAVCEALEATGTQGLAAERLDRLSGGRRQRCWLAMVLAQHTPVVFLDEPTSALELGHVVDVLALVREGARERAARSSWSSTTWPQLPAIPTP